MDTTINPVVYCGRCGRALKHHREHSIFGNLGTTCYSKVAALEQILTNLGMIDNHRNDTLFPAVKDENGNWTPPQEVVDFLNKPRKNQLAFTHEIVKNPDDPRGAPLVKINVQFDRAIARAAKTKSHAQKEAERVTRMLNNRERTLKNMQAPNQQKLQP